MCCDESGGNKFTYYNVFHVSLWKKMRLHAQFTLIQFVLVVKQCSHAFRLQCLGVPMTEDALTRSYYNVLGVLTIYNALTRSDYNVLGGVLMITNALTRSDHNV